MRPTNKEGREYATFVQSDYCSHTDIAKRTDRQALMERRTIDVGALQIQVVRVKGTRSKSLLMKPCCRKKIE
jgi:hypothetical protein